MTSKRQMFRRSMVVGFFSLLGGLTGVLVETSIAAKLGLSKSSDTFYVAFTVPYIITNLISATGQFSLVPFFSALDARHSTEELWKGFSYAVNVVFLGLSGIALAGIVASPWLIRGIAPGFDHAQTELAGHLARSLFLIIIPAGVSEIFRSFLFSQHRFALPAAAGFFRNIIVVLCILFTFDKFGFSSIVLGYFGGYLFQLVILGSQILAAFRVRYSLTLASGGEAFRNLRGAGTAQVTVAMAWQGVVIVERIIASFLPPGTLTALNYGFKIMSTLSELLAGSVGTAALPALSRAFANQEHERGRKTFRDTLEIGLALVTPVAVFCLMLDRNIMRLIFERGNFTPQATALMAAIFFYYSLNLLALAFLRVLTFDLFARNEVWVFVRLSFLQYGLTILFDLIYVGIFRMGAKGIPLALLTSLTMTTGLALYRDLGGLREVVDRAFAIFSVKNLAGAALAALTVWGLCASLPAPATVSGNFFFLCAVCGAGLLGFLGTLALTRAVEVSQITAIWKRLEDS
jgi:putative peptidoglycan lipid II flippase